VFISKVTEGGAAARDGRLRVGDQIISVGLLILFSSIVFMYNTRLKV